MAEIAENLDVSTETLRKRPEAVFRIAIAEDAPAIFDLLLPLHDEFPVAEINHMRALWQIKKAIAEGLTFIVEIDGRVVGSCALLPTRWWFSDEYYLGDLWTFVHPKFRRRTNAGRVLLKGVKEAVSKTGLPTFLGVRSLIETDRKNTLYRRYFKSVGEIFACGLPKQE